MKSLINKNDSPAASHNGEDQNSAISRILRIAAVPIAAISGFFVGDIEINSAAKQKSVKDGTFSDTGKRAATPTESAKPGTLVNILEVNDKANAINREMRTSGAITHKEFKTREREIIHEWRKACDERMKYYGRETLIDKFHYVSRSARQKAMIDGMTVFGVALAAVLTLSDSKVLASLSKKSDEEVKER